MTYGSKNVFTSNNNSFALRERKCTCTDLKLLYMFDQHQFWRPIEHACTCFFTGIGQTLSLPLSRSLSSSPSLFTSDTVSHTRIRRISCEKNVNRVLTYWLYSKLMYMYCSSCFGEKRTFIGSFQKNIRRKKIGRHDFLDKLYVLCECHQTENFHMQTAYSRFYFYFV